MRRMEPLKVQEIYLNSVPLFQDICGIYKSALDRNLGRRFCINGHCKKLFMIELTFDGCHWRANPQIYNSETEAKEQAEALKRKFPLIREYRIVTRKLAGRE